MVEDHRNVSFTCCIVSAPRRCLGIRAFVARAVCLITYVLVLMRLLLVLPFCFWMLLLIGFVAFEFVWFVAVRCDVLAVVFRVFICLGRLLFVRLLAAVVRVVVAFGVSRVFA